MVKVDNNYPLPLMITILVISGWILYGLLLASFFVGITALSYLYQPIMKIGLYFILIALCFGIIWTFIMVISILIRRELISFLPTRVLWLKYFAPVARSIAKRTGLDYELVIWSLIKISNEFIINEVHGRGFKDIMIMLPHCLQLESCGNKITSDIRNCKRCGGCIVDELIELSDRLSVDIFVATGGSAARKYIIERRPKLVLAVACERDLLSGIRDILPLRAIGIINQRPEGPCVNTTVDITQIELVINKIKG